MSAAPEHVRARGRDAPRPRQRLVNWIAGRARGPPWRASAGENPPAAPRRIRGAAGRRRCRIAPLPRRRAPTARAPMKGSRDRPPACGTRGAAAASAAPPSKLSRPDQRRDVLDRSRPRQRHRVVAAVVEPVAVDQRDRRLEHRHAPLQRARRPPCRDRAALFGPPPQPLDVVARVAPLARRARRRLRADQAAADVRVERRPADAEQTRSASAAAVIQAFAAHASY